MAPELSQRGAWVARVVAAVLWGAITYGLNAVAMTYGSGVNIPLVVGWWALISYFSGAMNHGR